jgi:glycosyltransferase involved in cell wall biosynthesis
LTAKVAIVASNDWYFMWHRLPIARAARDAGHQVLAVAAEEHGYGARIRAEGFRFIRIPVVRGSMNLSDELAAMRELLSIYRHESPDLVHHVSVKPVIYGSIAARIVGVPVIINALTGQGYLSGAGGIKGTLLRGAAHVAFRAALGGRRTRAIFENPDDLEAFVKRGLIPRHRAVLIRGSGVDPERFSPSPEPTGVPVVLFAARLLWSKGLGDLVEAVGSLRGRGIEVRLVIVGVPDRQNPDSIPEAVLQGWVKKGIAEWWGHRDDMPAVFRVVNIVALPSVYGEGVPVVLLEAAAAARAIVTTDTPGCREIVRDGVNGRLVPPNDKLSLADALSELLHFPELRARMAAAGREIASQEFSNAIVVRRTMQLYDQLLDERRIALQTREQPK